MALPAYAVMAPHLYGIGTLKGESPRIHKGRVQRTVVALGFVGQRGARCLMQTLPHPLFPAFRRPGVDKASALKAPA